MLVCAWEGSRGPLERPRVLPERHGALALGKLGCPPQPGMGCLWSAYSRELCVCFWK